MADTFESKVRLATRRAATRPLDVDLVRSHLVKEPRAAEIAFARALDVGIAGLEAHERHGGMNAVTGHIAESVAATLLVEAGWHVLEQFTQTASGGHGIDLAVLAPDMSSVFVVEVKGSLSRRGWPRLSRGELDQFTLEWLNKPDNPGMASLGMTGDDVSGLVMLINFARREWKAVATPDFDEVVGLSEDTCLDDPSGWSSR
ncbi:NERD domain-containing protein [Nocardioides plantarum]|uniref:NERD domain-containing protein n=1 Tax=Nocardioides plantarum TaxID=29299 RepID=A0ABV5K8G3_9ACTN|nr:NERD domain-containing protein [Nocardioides plantarum]